MIELYHQLPKEFKAIDLHSDLLSYLSASSAHTPFDAGSCCSLKQFCSGGVGRVVLPIFAPTEPCSHQVFEKQLMLVEKLVQKRVQKPDFRLAVENASTFISSSGSIREDTDRFEQLCSHRGVHLVYVSLTWNGENRLGGGVGSAKGLTEHGRDLINVLARHCGAIDLSHASDAHASDILAYTASVKSPLQVIASHSNFRSVTDVPRNLPDVVAEQIVERGGLIGLTLVKPFIGPEKMSFFEHVEYALVRGWERSLALGADFFSPRVFSSSSRNEGEWFFPQWQTPECIAELSQLLKHHFGEELTRGIMCENAQRVLFS